MLPLFNPFLGATAPASQQVPLSNPGPNVNPTNTLQNPLQMGMLNPQNSIPFIPNLPNQFGIMPSQNNVLGMPHLGSAQSTPGFFNLQNCLQNLGQNAYPSNLSQASANLFGHNSANIPGNLQFCFQNLGQNFPMPMPNLNQVGPYNVPPSSRHMYQVAQPMGPQNPNFVPNQHLGPMCANGVMDNVKQDNLKVGPPTMGSNPLKQSSIVTQQLQGNSPILGTPSVQQWKNQQTSNFMKSQGHFGKDVGGNSNSNWKNSSSKNFTKNPKGKASHWGSRKSQSHHTQNTRGKVGNPDENQGKGPRNNNIAGNFCYPNSTSQYKVEKRRSLPLNYTEQEIQHWREERKKNYPSKANLEKKSAKKLINCEAIDAETKSRRQQLKEILAKQAELGVEVAEIPPQYLSDSEKRVHGGEENKKALGKERFQNKGHKRGRRDKRDRQRRDRKDRFSKKQRVGGNDSEGRDASNQPSLNEKKQTLLQKLLSPDIKRDKSRLLQVFRFMVMNSFFKDLPEKPLKFPSIVVKQSGHRDEVVDLKSSPTSGGVSEGIRKIAAGAGDGDGNDADETYENKDDATDAEANEKAHFAKVEGRSEDATEISEEEGEIID